VKTIARIAFLMFILLAGVTTFAQDTLHWQRINLSMILPFPSAEAEIEEDAEGLSVFTDDAEVEFLLIRADSVLRNFPNPAADLIYALAIEFDLIITGKAHLFPSIPNGQYLSAVDTSIFTDSLLIGAFPDPTGRFFILVVFDCYGTPLQNAISMFNSFLFKEAVLNRKPH
jgi:hypothetical protein